MSAVGFDVGNETGVVGVARQRGIDVVLNEESKRETPGMVSFGEKQRFLGTAAAASSTMKPKNTISQVKRLIARKFKDPEVQEDLKQFPFYVNEASDGNILIGVDYLGEKRFFTPTQVLGMILSNLKSIAEKNLGTHVTDCVIGIPVFFTELQRRAYLDAAAIAGLHPLRLMHETTATALAYGIYRTDLPETEPIHVVFADIGHASTQVCIASFRKGQLKILSQAFDRSLGGRDFDEILFKHFALKFKEQYDLDILANVRASHRLRAACEKVKKVLSANAGAPLNIECLMDEKDVKGFIKREEFENLAEPLLERLRLPLEKALEESNLTVDRIYSVEVVGSGSRIPAIMRILAALFKKEPSRTLNASECIARGCALQCAMLSPTFRVKEFEMQDAYPFPIALSWKGSAPEQEDAAEPTYSNSIVFPRGNSIPSTKMLTFYRSGTFTIDVLYADMSGLPPETSPKISSYTIGPFSSKSEKGKLKVKIRLNLHGIVSVESATLIEEEEVELPVSRGNEGSEVSSMETDKDGNGTDKAGDTDQVGDVDMSDKVASMEAENSHDVNNLSGKGTHEKGETEVPKEVAKKKKIKKQEKVHVQENVLGALPQNELQKAVEKEYEFALQDRVMEETKDRKNAVEAYVYDMRNKLYQKLQDYVTESERAEIFAKLQHTEDWLYEDGEDEIKSVYIAKLEELKKLGDPLEERQREEEGRGPAVTELHQRINSFREAAFSTDSEFDHIDVAEKEKVVVECNKAEEWLRDKMQQQDSLPKTAKPVLFMADIGKKTEVLDRFCKPILKKPKPSPPKVPQQAAEPKGNEKKENKGAANGCQSGEGNPASDPMDSDNTPPEEEGMQTE